MDSMKIMACLAKAMETDVDTLLPVSYTHLDVYKRQILGTGDFTLENQGVPLISVRNETVSLSFESYVRTVLRLRERLANCQVREELLLQKMPFDSRYYPLYVNETGLAAKEMWARMWLRRKEES